MTHVPQPSNSSALALVGKRVVVGLLAIVVGLFVLKLLVGFVIGLVTTVLTLVAVVALVVAGIWAYSKL